MQEAIMTWMMIWCSVIAPEKGYFAADQDLTIQNTSKDKIQLVLTDFAGVKQELAENADATVAAGGKVDIQPLFPALELPGTYLLYATKDGDHAKFVGTPLVVSVKEHEFAARNKEVAGVMVTQIQPLRYVEFQTTQGKMTLAFYYDVAPNTTENFLRLSERGYYDGLTFHRIIPSFVIQGGDPRGDGSGGPGYSIDQEFNDRKHLPGVLSMARGRDVNSAGSQFFVCLDYQQTRNLDRQYTAFGKVTTGMDTVKKIAGVKLKGETPVDPPKITKAVVKSVTVDDNPYKTLFVEEKK